MILALPLHIPSRRRCKKGLNQAEKLKHINAQEQNSIAMLAHRKSQNNDNY